MLALIMILGVAFRFLYLDEIRHTYDLGYPAYDALRLLDGQQLRLLSQPSSVFLDNPPLMAYLQTIPLYFWRSIWSVYLLVTALNSLAIWFVYQATRKVLREPAGLMAAFLFAISPWVVHFSRMPWVQGLLPLYTAVIAWGLWPVLVTKENAPWRIFIAMLALTAMIQSYIFGLAMLLPVGILLLLFIGDLQKRAFLAGTLILFISLVLFGIGLARNEGQNRAKLDAFISDNEFAVNSQAVEHAIRFVTGLDYEGQGLDTDETILSKALSEGSHLLLGLALLAGFIRALLALRYDNQERRLAVLLLVWYMVPILGLLFLPYLVHPHYLLLTLPAGHVLAAWGTMPLLRRRPWRLAIVLVLLSIAGLFWFNLDRAGQAVANNPSGDRFNDWALADVAKIGQTIRELTPDTRYPRRIVAEGNSPLLSSISATYINSMSELDISEFILLPGQEPLLYVLVNQAPESALAGPNQESLPKHTVQAADGTSVSFLRIWPYDRDQALMLPQTNVDWTSDSGLTILGYSLETPPPYRVDHSLVITTYWRVEELHPNRAEMFVAPFFHILNEESQIMANTGAAGQWAYRWLSGDVYVYRTRIPLPDYMEPGPHQLAIGLSDPIQGTRFLLNSPSGSEPFHMVPIQIDK